MGWPPRKDLLTLSPHMRKGNSLRAALNPSSPSTPSTTPYVVSLGVVQHAGTRWTSYRPGPHPRGVLNGVHAASAREVWAAGTPGNDGTGDGVLLTRWDGQRWKVAFRIPTVDALRGLADVTTAGGHVFSVGGTTQTLAVQN